MDLSTPLPAADRPRALDPGAPFADAGRSLASAVSWGAIVAGAAAAASLSLILLMLGVGLGLSSVSPWARDGVGAATFGISTILWLTLTQLLASGMGGYLAGRLRARWTEVHGDEVYFRDTAHGFLSWAVATLATAALLTSAIASIVGGGVQAGASVVGGAASTAASAVGGAAGASGTSQGDAGATVGYFVDALFRRDADAAPAAAPATGTAEAAGTAVAPAGIDGGERTPDRASAQDMAQHMAEVGRIFVNASRTEPLPPEDLRHVGALVAQRTGLSQQAAERRVAAVHARAQAQVRAAETAVREAADTARKASAYSAIWLFVALLSGAFVASFAATLGGRRRDA